jgi:hypothetical protein
MEGTGFVHPPLNARWGLPPHECCMSFAMPSMSSLTEAAVLRPLLRHLAADMCVCCFDSELQQKQPHNVCPEREWLPEECIGSLREKSKKVYDHCELFFSETGYTQELLKQCGILASTSP